MNTLPENVLETVLGIGERLAGERLPIVLARLYSHQTRVRASQPGLSSWRDEETIDRLRDAEMLVEAAFIKKQAVDKTWRRDLRRAAEIFEWLSVAIVVLPDIPTAMLSAAAYQLAGFPARALGVLNTNLATESQSAVIAAFLNADFGRLLVEIRRFWQNAYRADEQSNSSSSNEIKLGETIIDETIRSLGILCSWLRWGNGERLEKAINKIKAVSNAMVYGPDAYSWLLARLVSEITKEYEIVSLRKNVGVLQPKREEAGKAVLERYVRLAFKERMALAWPSQRDGIVELATGSSFALCTPTGSGKTRVAELAILDAVFPADVSTAEEQPLPVVLYLVPSRALASEMEFKLSRVFNQISAEQVTVTSLYGGTDWGPSDSFLALGQRAVIISTHEKAEALIRLLGDLFVNRIKLIIIDEAHSVEYEGAGDDLRDSSSRALRLETLVSRIFTRLQKGDYRVVALSAAAAGIELDIAHWVSRNLDAEPVTTRYQSTRQLVGRLECLRNRSARIRYDLLDGQRLKVAGLHADDSPYIPEPFPKYPPAPHFGNKVGPEKKLRPQLFWAAMHLAARDVQGNYHSVLISVPQQPGGYGEDFLTLLEKDWKDYDLPDFFRKPQEGEQQNKLRRCLKSCEDYFGEKSREYRLLSHGIVLHHGKMPGVMSRLLVDLVRERIVNLVIATSTLTEGVNLPFETILIASLRRSGNYLSTREFSNLIGRAGRPGISTEGRSLVLMDPASTAPGQYGTRTAYAQLISDLAQGVSGETQIKQDRGPLGKLLTYIEEKWIELAKDASMDDFVSWLENTVCDESDEGSYDAITALDTLDGVLVAAIEESEELTEIPLEGSDLEAFLQRLWRNSFSCYSAIEQERLEQIIIARGRGLIDRIYPARQVRRRLYQTSLTPREGKRLIESLSQIEELLKAGEEYCRWEPKERIGYISSLIEFMQQIPSFSLSSLRGRYSWRDVLHWWLDPTDSPIQPSPAQVSIWYDYGARNFGYRFNWAIGCIFGTLLADISIEKTMFDRWTQTGLPWSVFWLKDLITWGLLDPVATYLLMKGITDTRMEAAEIAYQYWEKWKGQESDSAFDPRRIGEWVSRMTEEDTRVVRAPRKESVYEVVVMEDFKDKAEIEWQVLPIVSMDTIHWLDPAGYELAKGEKPADWENVDIEEYDFLLKPSRAEVIARPYL